MEPYGYYTRYGYRGRIGDEEWIEFATEEECKDYISEESWKQGSSNFMSDRKEP